MTEDHFSCPRAAQGHSCAPCEELALIDEELRLLIENRAHICSCVNRAHDSLTTKLPSEIMSKIFMTFRPIDVDKNYGVCINHRPRAQHSTQKIVTTPVLLSAVCTAWRTIAWSTPQLWTSISVNLTYELHLDLLRKWLARSGALSLYVNIYTSKGWTEAPYDRHVAEDILKLFASYAHRWSFLELSIPPTLIPFLRSDVSDPLMLNTLKIKGYDIPDGINLGLIPNVRTIYMDDLKVGKLQNLNFKKLNDIEGVFSSVDAIFHVFSNAPCITRFTFKIEPEDQTSAETSRDTVIQHASLAFLHAELCNSLTQTVLSWMTFPALQHLVVDSVQVPNGLALPQVDIADLIRRSFCSLKTLEVDISREDLHFGSRIIPLLESVPSIETLQIKRNVGSNHSSSNHFSIDPLLILLSTIVSSNQGTSNEPAFLPNLKTLRLRNVEFSWNCVVDILQAHLDAASMLVEPPSSSEESEAEAGPIIRPLRVLHFALTKEQYQTIRMDVIEKLAMAIDAGFQFFFNLGTKF